MTVEALVSIAYVYGVLIGIFCGIYLIPHIKDGDDGDDKR